MKATTTTEMRLFLEGFGKRLKYLRKQRHLTQHEVAALCDMEKASLSRIENGKTNLTILSIKRLADVLQISIASFFVEDNVIEYKQILRGE